MTGVKIEDCNCIRVRVLRIQLPCQGTANSTPCSKSPQSHSTLGLGSGQFSNQINTLCFNQLACWFRVTGNRTSLVPHQNPSFWDLFRFFAVIMSDKSKWPEWVWLLLRWLLWLILGGGFFCNDRPWRLSLIIKKGTGDSIEVEIPDLL